MTKTKILNEPQDYIKVDIIKPSCTYLIPTHLSPNHNTTKHQIISNTIINNLFTKNKQVNHILIHRRLSRASDRKINEMCKHSTLIDLPNNITKNNSNKLNQC